MDIKENIDKIQLKIFSLDVQLKEYYSQNIITAKQYSKRAQKLQKLIQNIENLKINLQIIDQTQHTNQQNSLPDLLSSNEEQKKICTIFLMEKLKHAIKTLKQLKKLMNWIEKLSVPYFINTLRLSFLRNKLNKIEHQIFLEEQQNQILQLNITKLNSQFAQSNPKNINLSNIDSIIQLNSNIELTTVRINRLQNEIQKEEHTIKQMKEYLNQLIAQEKVALIQPKSTVTLTDIQNIYNKISNEFANNVSKTEKQLNLAKDFITTRLNSDINIELQNANIKNSLIIPELHYPTIKIRNRENLKYKNHRQCYVS